MRQKNEASDSLRRVSAQLGLQVGVVYLFHVVKVEVDGAPMNKIYQCEVSDKRCLASPRACQRSDLLR